MAVGLVDFLDGSQYYPVYRSLLSQLDSLSIIRLSRTCRGLASLYRGAIRTEWNMDRLLRRFVSQPLALREQMRDHRAVIGGSFALQFFERVCWPEDSLDLYVQKPSEAQALEEHLVGSEGYRRLEAEERYQFYGVCPSSRWTIVDRNEVQR